jgi:hypothetical protein
MFKNRLWMGWRVTSDEGFEIEWGSDVLRYKENKRTMLITIDCGANDITVFGDTATRWDDDPLHSIEKSEQSRIIDNISRALTFYQDLHHGKLVVRDL